MVIPSFTPEQIVAEFRKDLVNIFYYVDHQKQRLRRAALKAHKFPVSIHGWHTSPMKNNWLYILSAQSKKDYDDTSMVTFVMTFRDQQGKTWAMMQSSVRNEPIVIFYTPHLFARYSMRMNLNLLGEELAKEGLDIDETFEKKFCSFQLKTQKPGKEIYLKALEGIGCDPSEILFIEDSPANLKTAQELGIQTLRYYQDLDIRKSFVF